MKLNTLAISALLLWVIHPSVVQAEQSKLKLGFIGSLSGAAQVYGEAAKNGIELALDEVGRDWIDVVYEDDGFLPAKTVAAFKKLTSVDHVDAVVCVGSSPCNAVAPLAQSAKVPLFAWASDRRVSTGRPFVVRSYPSGDAEGAQAAREAISRGFAKVGVIISSNDYTNSWRGGFLSTVPKESVQLNEELAVDNPDYRALILRAQSKGVDALALCLNPGQTGVFARQLHELGHDIKLFGCEYLHDKAEIDAARGALNDSWFVTVTVRDDFKNKYAAKYHNDSVISGGANHYDLIHLLFNSFKKSGREGWYQAVLDSGESSGAVGKFKVTEIEGDRFFDIALQVKLTTSS